MTFEFRGIFIVFILQCIVVTKSRTLKAFRICTHESLKSLARAVLDLPNLPWVDNAGRMDGRDAELRGLRERAAFDGQCLELSDGYLVDMRDLLEMVLLNSSSKNARSRVPLGGSAATAITICELASGCVRVLFVMVSTPANFPSESPVFFFSFMQKGQYT